MKKITLFMMALIMTFGAMAQFSMEQRIMQNNTESNVVALNKNISLDNLSNATFVKHVNGTKTVGATITGVTIGTLAGSGIPVSFTVTPSTDCVSYFITYFKTGLIESITTNLDTIGMFIKYYGQEMTGTQNLTAAMGTGDSNTIYVLAVAADQTTSLATSNVVTPNHGGTGTANVATTVYDVTHTTAGVTFALNDQADYFYYALIPASYLTQHSWTTDSVISSCEKQDRRNYLSVSVEDSVAFGISSPLDDNTEYVLYAFAYNQNDVLGTAAAPIHFTTGQSGLNDVETISTSVYPNPAKDVVNLTSSSKMNRVEMFNIMGQKVSEKSVNSMFTSVNVANLNAGTYVVKVYTNAGVATKKIVVE